MISTEFQTTAELRHGGVMSPILFDIFMDDITKEWTPQLRKLHFGYRKLHIPE